MVDSSYSAKDIEVLEGLEPVRRHPGMYIGGVDEKAFYHMIAEVLDNSMDEAVAGHANVIKIHLDDDNSISIEDNGRGIPIDPHPKYPNKSALEVILTTLHSGGKFNNKAYATSGGLHGVGISVVNALSSLFYVEVKRDGQCFSQEYSKGKPVTDLNRSEAAKRAKGTRVKFIPDDEIFKDQKFSAQKVYRIACSKGYLFKGVKIEWSCDQSLLAEEDKTAQKATIFYPNGLRDFLPNIANAADFVSPEHFYGEAEFTANEGRVEWAINWLAKGEGVSRSYCNTIPTPLGGTHENGFRLAIVKGLKSYAEMIGNKKASVITSDDVDFSSAMLLSIFIKHPSYQGQTKEKLLTNTASKWVENAVRHAFDNWLVGHPKVANAILELAIENAELRKKAKRDREVNRKNPIKSLRLPGKLADCHRSKAEGTELFIVEGESAGGTAKQGRNRETQAILPLKGKILNVASSSRDKIKANQEISDLTTALGCAIGSAYSNDDLRYEKVIIMTDADVDGAHITSLLLSFFYLQMPELIRNGHLYLAQPPLYKITQGSDTYYIADDVEKNKLLEKIGNKKFEIGRFKGLGEMSSKQLKETTMDPKNRSLLKVMISEEEVDNTSRVVDELMGKNPEMRFKFITERTSSNFDQLNDLLDI